MLTAAGLNLLLFVSQRHFYLSHPIFCTISAAFVENKLSYRWGINSTRRALRSWKYLVHRKRSWEHQVAASIKRWRNAPLFAAFDGWTAGATISKGMGTLRRFLGTRHVKNTTRSHLSAWREASAISKKQRELERFINPNAGVFGLFAHVSSPPTLRPTPEAGGGGWSSTSRPGSGQRYTPPTMPTKDTEISRLQQELENLRRGHSPDDDVHYL